VTSRVGGGTNGPGGGRIGFAAAANGLAHDGEAAVV